MTETTLQPRRRHHGHVQSTPLYFRNDEERSRAPIFGVYSEDPRGLRGELPVTGSDIFSPTPTSARPQRRIWPVALLAGFSSEFIHLQLSPARVDLSTKSSNYQCCDGQVASKRPQPLPSGHQSLSCCSLSCSGFFAVHRAHRFKSRTRLGWNSPPMMAMPLHPSEAERPQSG
jgi:hypothetical protein